MLQQMDTINLCPREQGENQDVSMRHQRVVTAVESEDVDETSTRGYSRRAPFETCTHVKKDDSEPHFLRRVWSLAGQPPCFRR